MENNLNDINLNIIMQELSPALKMKPTQEKTMKPRNHVVLALLKSKRKSGVHEKSKKAVRQQDKIKLAKGQMD